MFSILSNSKTPSFDIMFESLINESNDESGMWKYQELYDEMINQFINELTANPDGRQKWEVLPAAKVKEIWNDYAKYRFVRDEEAVNELAFTMARNTAKLQVNTEMAGHSQLDPNELWQMDREEDMPQELDDKMGDWMLTDEGQWRISDYGLNKLVPFAMALLNDKETAEEKLIDMDRMLQICHQRGDLALNFIEGGSNTLTEIYQSPSETSAKAMIDPPKKPIKTGKVT